MAKIILFGEMHASKGDKNRLESYDLSKIDAFFSEGRDNTCDIVKISKGKDIFEAINCLSFLIGALVWFFTFGRLYKSSKEYLEKSSKKYGFEIYSDIDIPITELCKITKKWFFVPILTYLCLLFWGGFVILPGNISGFILFIATAPFLAILFHFAIIVSTSKRNEFMANRIDELIRENDYRRVFIRCGKQHKTPLKNMLERKGHIVKIVN